MPAAGPSDGGERDLLPPLRSPLPKDPGEKWKAIKAALANDDMTKRMRKLIIADSLRLALVCITVIVVALILVVR